MLTPPSTAVARVAAASVAALALLLGAAPAQAETVAQTSAVVSDAPTATPAPLVGSAPDPSLGDPKASTGEAYVLGDTVGATGIYFNALVGGESLLRGESIQSVSGDFVFWMQTDGNAVVYGRDGHARWSSGTAGRGDHLVMQTDGNVVVYTAAGVPVWNAETMNEPGAIITIQDDGNLVVYREDGSPAWASIGGGLIAPPAYTTLYGGGSLTQAHQLTSYNGDFKAVMQIDGNFVVYGPLGVLWFSGTSGAGNHLEMQTDGNAVIYSASGAVKWFSGTSSPTAAMQLGDDGNLIIFNEYNDAGYPIWNSAAQARRDTLEPNGHLYGGSGDKLVSANGRYRAVSQADGNFVVYGPSGAVWSTGSSSVGQPGQFFQSENGWLSAGGVYGNHWTAYPRDGSVAPYKVVMQNDGNLVQYDGAGRPSWASRGL